MKYNPHLYNVSLPDTYYRFFEVGMGYFLTDGGSPNFASSYDFEKYERLIGGQVDPSSLQSSQNLIGDAIVVS